MLVCDTLATRNCQCRKNAARRLFYGSGGMHFDVMRDKNSDKISSDDNTLDK